MMLGYSDLTWDADILRKHGSKKTLATVVADETYPTMWRVRMPDGRVSGILNKARAKDAAMGAALQALNAGTGPGGAARSEFSPAPALSPIPIPKIISAEEGLPA
jgi:hypothetical protein